MPVGVESWKLLWVRTAGVGLGIILFVFGGYEIIERTLLVGAAPTLIYSLHIVRGMGTAILLGTWAFVSIMRTRHRYEQAIRENVEWLEREVAERTRDLRRSNEFAEHLFDSLQARIIVTDAEGRVVKANRVARECVGGPIVGGLCIDRFEECVAGGCAAAAAFATNEAQIDKEVRRDPRTGRVWAISTQPVPDEDGRPRLVIEVARDVTEEKNREAQLRHQEKMASLGQLAAGLAHDIGNPLASLSSELEILEYEDDVERFRESVRVLRTHVDRIGRSLREMVDFARRRTDEEADISIATAVEDSLRLVKHDPRARPITMLVDVPRDLPTVRMVEDHLVLVLVNLIINAVDAMPNGGTLEIGARATDGGAQIVVRDSGVGMTDEVRRNATTPMFTTKEGKGTGLGLSVSNDVMCSVGGTLALESEVGKGTSVTLFFPARRISRRLPVAAAVGPEARGV